MFKQAELRGIPLGPDGPPNSKEEALNRLGNFPSGKPGLLPSFGLVIWVILAFGAKQAILAVLATHFRGRMDLPKESSTWSPA